LGQLSQSTWQDWVVDKKEVDGSELNERTLLITQAWKKSIDKKVNPFLKKIPLLKKKNENSQMVCEFLERVRDTVEIAINGTDKQTAWIVCNRKGFVSNILSRDEAFEASLAQKGLVVGQCLSLAHSGTHGISLAMQNMKLSMCIANEHYCELFHQLISCGIHLCDIKGEVIAYLGVFVHKDVGVRYLATMLRLIVKSLDNRGRLDRSTKLHENSRDRISTMFGRNEKDAVLLVTREGILRQANAKAMTIFNIKKIREDKTLDTMAHFTPNISEMASSSIRETLDVNFKDARKRAKYSCCKIPCYNNDDHFIGVMLVFNRVGKNEIIKQGSSDSTKFTFGSIIGKSPQIMRAKNMAKQLAKSDINVLITGESGTGKEVFAQSIHNASPFSSGPFVSLNCSAIPKDLAESELFGYVKGAFTGALNEGKLGVLENANNGTLFLDEIGDMPLDLQVKLLRALETRAITRVGSDKEIKINIRIIAATNRNLEEMIEEETFREDLFYRIGVGVIHLPSLRECKENVPELFKSFLFKYSKRSGKDVKINNPKIMEKLKEYSWKGNIRELKNAAEFAVMMNSGNEDLTLEHLPGRMRIAILYQSNENNNMITSDPEVLDLQPSLNKRLELCLNNTNWDVTETAKILRISRATLYRKMKKNGLLKRDVEM